MVTRHRLLALHEQNYRRELCQQLNNHRHILISPAILVLLSVPRLIISLLPNCFKSFNNPWLYLSAYFISFVPSVTVFAVFVLPSDLYKQQCKQTVRSLFH